ncbi:DUF4186 family protein [uncultured Desulfosarcina sp.]|uniref:DUF4186 family protein n=1 Tax=uncultured Desulfosarcina sp. TaxID=218289 RepID=UPI003749F8FE
MHLIYIHYHRTSCIHCPACDRDLRRGCLWKWHGIEKVRLLTEDEIGFVVELVMGWIGDQI